MCRLPGRFRSGTNQKQAEDRGLEKHLESPKGGYPQLSGHAVIAFGIACCAATMAVVLTVALLAS